MAQKLCVAFTLDSCMPLPRTRAPPTQVPATCAVFAPGAAAAATCCPGERHVAVWATPQARQAPGTEDGGDGNSTPGKSSKKSLRSAAAVLSLDHPATHVDAGPCGHVQGSQIGGGLANGHADSDGLDVGKAGGPWCLAAVSEAGEAYAWRCEPAAGNGEGVATALLARVCIAPRYAPAWRCLRDMHEPTLATGQQGREASLSTLAITKWAPTRSPFVHFLTDWLAGWLAGLKAIRRCRTPSWLSRCCLLPQVRRGLCVGALLGGGIVLL
jgi:hypothetical protein